MQPPFQPIAEQQRALDLFLQGGNLRIDAYAGAGKTATLRLLANSTQKKGLYLAFNRSIALEAQQTFPPHIACVTSHSIAFRGVRRTFKYPENKLTGSLTLNSLLEAFRLPESITFRAGFALPRQSYAAALLEGTRAFLRSSDQEPSLSHIPRYGMLEFIPEDKFLDFAQQAVGHVQAIWSNMCAREGVLPLGHDGYLKLWALSKPVATADYIMVDEAQDLNPVLLGVLRSVACPLVYVGDPFQQIYDWRGAINAMNQVKVDHRVLLSQSFRFGPALAQAATEVIRRIGATEPVRGNVSLTSHLARVRPDAILSRSNAGVITHVLRSLKRNERCYVLGGTKTLELLLDDVRRIKAGKPAITQELLGFSSWKDVLVQSTRPEGADLRQLVGLVREFGEARIQAALSRCETEERMAQVVCSTAHRAKGREWDHVLLDEDFDTAIARSLKPEQSREKRTSGSDYEAEMRLLYVALTRARIAVELPPAILARLRLKLTTEKVLGKVAAPAAIPDEEPPLSPDHEVIPAAVSPYHSPQKNEPPEMAAIRRFFS
ncbi:UvrD-helicase domain-containing protein [Edaphobacter aggregans]|uniref:UvrD-helicase domain-containing protein n=1 Tax=Edaphobacter aggregans TaxID=570835 RepID=UPI000A3FBFC8|nr:UvrD-helicase domain-containing protein [Edaphobacter aggregans]